MQKRTRRRLDAWIVVAIVHVGIALLLLSSTGGCGRSTRETDGMDNGAPEEIKIEDMEDTSYDSDDGAVVVDPGPVEPIGPSNTTPVEAGHEVRYVVQAGDSLWKISRKFGVSVDAIADRNDIQDKNMIRVGRELWIPNPTKGLDQETPADSTTETTTIDTTTVTDPMETDPGEMTSPEDVTGPEEPVDLNTIETIEYEVQPGDTIWKLARQYHTTTKIIMDLNGITDATKMRAGDTILIPKPAGE